MTFTAFVMFDMFNALACRHNSKPVFELAWNSNGAFLLALAFSLGGQVCVFSRPWLLAYGPPGLSPGLWDRVTRVLPYLPPLPCRSLPVRASS